MASVLRSGVARAGSRSARWKRVEARSGGGEEWLATGVTRDDLLRSNDRRAAGRAGNQKLAIFLVNGEIHATQKGCPHLNVSLLDGELEPSEGILRCGQHGSSWKLPSGEVDEWLPPNQATFNVFQRLIEPACNLKVFETDVGDDGQVYVR